MKKNDIFYGDSGSERLTHTDIDEAIEYILDDMTEIPKTIPVSKFKRIDTSKNVDGFSTYILDALIEKLDEEFGDPEGTETKETDGMKISAKTFIENVLKEYVCWQCEEVEKIEINCKEWILKNRANWIIERIVFLE